MKWLAAAAVLAARGHRRGTLDGLAERRARPVVTFIPFFAVYVGLVAAVVVAMLRHGLYDVDRVISRTIAWMALTLVLAAVAVALALFVAEPARRRLDGRRGSCRRRRRAGVRPAATPHSSGRWTGASTATAPAPIERVEAFAELASTTARPHPRASRACCARCWATPGCACWSGFPGPATYAGLDGAPAPPAPGPDVGRDGRRQGRGAAGARGPRPRARRSAPGCSPTSCARRPCRSRSARLRVSCAGASRRWRRAAPGIVRAGYEERRRLERDLHDGAQQRLVALGMALRLAQRRLADGTRRRRRPARRQRSPSCGTAVARAAPDRPRPAPEQLDDGLPAGAADLARRCRSRWTWTSQDGPLPDEVETTAYYVASEALANAVKHAEATRDRAAVAPRRRALSW